ncbi:MAG: bifunctional methylenetetrahydrofolate dehydrogenase/methenyltetrahydrofolate cyclohydrolase FolD [Clostridia bacterium]|jgi:methylenetetrahydrofolate dehydrogenase (NADP+)/methenyltetrahydrofolate cyclohydrolase|nr:bifunctional methylenetetrahydrofolate dehydrogenase/methenyltetrahydrofolate cyclohydrolase FolD [Clostridia bacterium]MDD4146654.1 bifunctional methylenetetrahydrofolate dehydrogenase/methenyltetrahydrofolate cyclohydrolase FolD [Clostridia bacterium]MDD4664945.1 bifunctional methylenetetrahydrofolate dehydrogenase/methenyltetrahydrofolate cyclohydrolase FolD [Clostridia bacterium]
MPAQIIEGKVIAKTLRTKIKKRVDFFKAKGIVPGLAVVLVGEDPASQIYVKNKAQACQECGIKSEVIKLPSTIQEKVLLTLMEKLNKRRDIHGILVQLPLPQHLSAEVIIEAINPAKDVDGLHPVNMGKLLAGNPALIPCTPYGCLKLIQSTGCAVSGKKAVVIGRSNLVGKPMAVLLLRENATVTACHSYTQDLVEITRSADILVVAVGKPGLITGEMIKSGALVLDVGMNRLPTGKLTGDVDFSSAAEIAGWITPVPGGVGPLTITMLLENTLEAAYEQEDILH